MCPRAGQERGRTTSVTSPYKLTIAWCEYSNDAGLVFATTELKNLLERSCGHGYFRRPSHVLPGVDPRGPI